MALGTERVILFAEDSVHIPDDLIGIGKIGVKYISYAASEFNSSVYRLGPEIEKAYDKLDKSLRTQIDSVIEHIKINADIISPVFIGAAVSSAEADAPVRRASARSGRYAVPAGAPCRSRAPAASNRFGLCFPVVLP